MPLAYDKFRSIRLGLALGIISSVAFGVTGAIAAEKVLYAFQGGNDGDEPLSGVIIDSSGNLYGTTSEGGPANASCQLGCGTAYEISAGGVETLLHTFTGGTDGISPYAGLIADSSGNLYGETEGGGGSSNCPVGCGTIFKLAPGGSESILYSFQGGSDGWGPQGGLIQDAQGNLYGTTEFGGNESGACANGGCGTVFELKSDGTKVTLYSFQWGTDGAGPLGGLIMDKGGNLYGTTHAGGSDCNQIGCGIVFELAPDGTETILHVFQGSADGDGNGPYAGLVFDSAGNLYGTTMGGGTCSYESTGCGTVFKVAPNGTEQVLHAFQAGSDGYAPAAGLVIDKSGNLYGTTTYGGGTHCKKFGFGGCGTVFKVTPNGTETIVISFGGDRGKYPEAALLLKNGKLYGTASGGGAYNDGTVFELKK